MGVADCLIQAGLVKVLQKSFKRQFGPLPDTLQAGACIFQLFPLPIQFLLVGQNGLCLLVIRFRSTPSTFPDRQATFYGVRSGSP